MRRYLVALVVALVISAGLSLFAQPTSIFQGSGQVSSGSTCPPTATPGSSAAVYTCTGTGALYTWTGSAWTAVGGGAGNPAGSNSQVQYNASGVFGASSNLTYSTSLERLVVGGDGTNASAAVWNGTNYIEIYPTLVRGDGTASIEFGVGFNKLSATVVDGISMFGALGARALVNNNVELFANDGMSHEAVVVVIATGGEGVGSFQPSRDQDTAIDLGSFAHAWKDIYLSGAVKTDHTNGHTITMQVYDVDGNAYKTFATLTNGNTPDMTIAAPSGGTITLQPSTYKSADGTVGATVTTCTSFKNGLCVAGT